MTGITAERLAALPEGTGIAYDTEGTTWWLVKSKGDAWFYVLQRRIRTSAQVLDMADPGSVRVVSVPVDALLNPKTAQFASRDPHGAAFDPFADRTLRRAVAHVTGETS